MRIVNHALFAAAILALTPGLASGQAPAVAVEPSFDLAAHEAVLGRLLSEKDYAALGTALRTPRSNAEASASLDWLGVQFKLGQSPFIAYTYSQMLAAFAQPSPPDVAGELRGMALAAMLFAIVAASVDAQQCADTSVRADRAQQFGQALLALNLLDLSEGERQRAAFVALAMERRTWPSRKLLDDTRFLCANGLAAINAAMERGTVREREAREGELGRQFTYQVPDGFEYERLPDAQWWDTAFELRSRVPDFLKTLARVEVIPGAAGYAAP